ncbi:MAG TPA: response regulator transcription factor [Anaerolineae bacterium]|jgi:DNA-binding NarL/FixJ family response regulator|nr:response regulator transcription factor [Anaerolineae bacterium]
MADLRLLVVAADPLARAGLVTLLDERPGLHIAGQVSGGESLAEELDVFQPDVLVFDLGWEPDEGLETLEELALEPEGGQPNVVALAPDEETAAAAWSAGARGVLPRTASAGGLEAAIHGVALGLAVIEPELLANAWPAGSSGEPGLDEALTPRELEVLQLLAEGLANKAIAQRLDISEHTVKFHVNAIMSKLGAQSRTAAVVRATRLGLIML